MHLIASMATKLELRDFKKILAAGSLPDLGPGPRADILPQAELEQGLDKLLDHSSLPSVSRDLIRALILLWQDRLDSAHTIAQGIESSDGGFVHGIVHRREPDYSNAAYWFRRVRAHPCFPTLANRVEEKLAETNALSLKDELIADGDWDPFAFIRLCEKVANRPANDPEVNLLRIVQGIETEVLLEHFLQPP
jgi:hypothetical protein